MSELEMKAFLEWMQQFTPEQQKQIAAGIVDVVAKGHACPIEESIPKPFTYDIEKQMFNVVLPCPKCGRRAFKVTRTGSTGNATCLAGHVYTVTDGK